jgi:hypothetical protein
VQNKFQECSLKSVGGDLDGTFFRNDVMTYDVMLALEIIGDQNPTSCPKMNELSCKLIELDELENQKNLS